jgi:hypothetical protein
MDNFKNQIFNPIKPTHSREARQFYQSFTLKERTISGFRQSRRLL